MANNSSSGGIGFTSVLQILFIAFKLLDVTIVASWSWWWVLSPTWIGICFAVLVIGIYGLFVYINEKRSQKRLKDAIDGSKSKFQQKLDEAMKASKDKQRMN